MQSQIQKQSNPSNNGSPEYAQIIQKGEDRVFNSDSITQLDDQLVISKDYLVNNHTIQQCNNHDKTSRLISKETATQVKKRQNSSVNDSDNIQSISLDNMCQSTQKRECQNNYENDKIYLDVEKKEMYAALKLISNDTSFISNENSLFIKEEDKQEKEAENIKKNTFLQPNRITIDEQMLPKKLNEVSLQIDQQERKTKRVQYKQPNDLVQLNYQHEDYQSKKLHLSQRTSEREQQFNIDNLPQQKQQKQDQVENIKKIMQKESNKMTTDEEISQKNQSELSLQIEEQERTKMLQQLQPHQLGKLNHQSQDQQSKKMINFDQFSHSEYQLIVKILTQQEKGQSQEIDNQQKLINSKIFNLPQIFKEIAQLNKKTVTINQIKISVGNKQQIIYLSKDLSKLILHQIRAHKILSLKKTLDNLTFKIRSSFNQMSEIKVDSDSFLGKAKHIKNNLKANEQTNQETELNNFKLPSLSEINTDYSFQQHLKYNQQQDSNLKFEIFQSQSPLNLNRNKLLGGGCGNSKQIVHPSKKLDKTNQASNKKQPLTTLKSRDLDILKHEFVVEDDIEDRNSENNPSTLFEKFYQTYYKDIQPVKHEKDVHVRQIIREMHEYRESIAEQTRYKIIDLINLVINFLLIILNDSDVRPLEKDLKLITGYLEDLKAYCYENRNRYPSLDLFYYFETLVTLNDSRKALDIINKSKFTQIFELIIRFVKIGAGFVSIQGAISNLVNTKLEDIKKFFDGVKKVYETVKQSFELISDEGIQFYDSYTKGKLKDKIQILWYKRIDAIGDDVIQAFQQSSEIENIEEETSFLEIFFYIDEVFQMRTQSSGDIVLFVFMQLNYLLSKVKINDPEFSLFSQKIQDRNKQSSIIEFVHLLQLSNYSATLKDKLIQNFTSFIISNTKFRYIRIQLMLKFAQILLNIKNVSEYHKIMINLCTGYLQEKDVSIKILFQNNQVIAQFIQKKDYYDEMIKESKRLRKQYTMKNNSNEINAFSNQIETPQDILRLLAINFAEMWQISVKQRQDSNKMAHKDDALLEALNLYIKQYVTYEQGYKFVNNNIESEDSYQYDAVKLIIDNFLIPNFQYTSSESEQGQAQVKKEKQEQAEKEEEKQTRQKQKEENQLDYKQKYQEKEIQIEHQELNSSSSRSTCKIISILAEGGSGKSMLLKKLEVELLKEQSQSEYRSDEKSNYLPFIIKCNQLDSQNPSIENYLQSQNLSLDEIKMLKSSEKNKLILLDGYDEYAGDYFKVYQVLRLFEWVNTLVIVTSRLERISVSDAKLYFNYYDQHGLVGTEESFAILKLSKMKNQDIIDYLTKFKDQKIQSHNFDSAQFQKLQSILLENKGLIELLKLPINLYLITRMMADLNLDDENILTTFQSATDQVNIQELFFSQQFEKQAEIFVSRQKHNTKQNNEKYRIIEKIKTHYFEYFQTIAMLMFVQKDKKSNFLSTTRESIKFSLREEDQTYLSNNQIKIEDLIQNLNNYVDSRVITKTNQSLSDSKCEEFEFRHKSLFEYFAARAMKYDFDNYQENIFQMDVSTLSQFNINKRIIMSSETNASEYQILVKLYMLIKPEIESVSFKQNYAKSDPSETNRYIQYLKKSQISKVTETSRIDIGCSNLLSALFVSNFCFPDLIFKKCSFSQVYISSQKYVDFELCNLEYSYLGKQQLQFFESSNTKNAIQDGFLKVFDSYDKKCEDVLICGDTFYSLNKNGYIHKYQITRENSCKWLLSNQFSSCWQKVCQFSKDEGKEFLVVQAQKSFFEIDKTTLEVMNYFKFTSIITYIQRENLQYIVTLKNQQQLEGNFVNGFKIKNGEKSINQIIQRNNSDEIMLWKAHINKIYEHINFFSFSFSKDGNYLSTINNNHVCTVWNIKNSFEVIKTITCNNNNDCFYYKSKFSSDFKYFAVTENLECRIFNIDQGFEFLIQIKEDEDEDEEEQKQEEQEEEEQVKQEEDQEGEESSEEEEESQVQESQKKDFIKSVAFSPDSNYFVVDFYKNGDVKIYNIKKQFLLIYHNKNENKSDFERNRTQIMATFSSDGRYLLTQTNIWNVQEQFKPVECMDFVEEYIYQAYFSPDMSYFYTISRSEIEKRQVLQRWNIQQEFKYVNMIGFDSDGFTILSPNCKILATQYDYKIEIKNVEKELEIINIIDFYSCQFEFSPDSKHIFITGSQFQLWNIEKGFNNFKKVDEFCEIRICAFSPDGKSLFTINDKCCQIFKTDKNFELVNAFQFQKNKIKQIQLSNNCKYLIILSANEDNCKIYNVQDQFKLMHEIKFVEEKSLVIFSQDSKYLAIKGEKQISIYNVEKQFKEIKVLEDDNFYTKLCFSPNGKYFAKCYKSLVIFYINNQYQVTQIKKDIISDFCEFIQFSSNSQYLVINTQQGIYILNADNQFKQEFILNQEYNQFTEDIKFSQDNKLLVTCSHFLQKFQIWNAEKFEIIESIEVMSSIKSVDISPDNKYLSIYSKKEICEIWNIENIDSSKYQSTDKKQITYLEYSF